MRCRKCKIAGETADLARHEPDCVAVPCSTCNGRGGRSWIERVRPVWHKCDRCDGSGVEGGFVAMWNAQEEARQHYRETVSS